MVERCTNPNGQAYAFYRDVQIHPAWMDFETFRRDVGERPSLAHSLDRFPDPSGGYAPGNVRWATYREQRRNQRVPTKLNYDKARDIARRLRAGESPSALAREYGVHRSSIRAISRGTAWVDAASAL
jgi:hypothetical protein